jgi:hypothetical protein
LLRALTNSKILQKYMNALIAHYFNKFLNFKAQDETYPVLMTYKADLILVCNLTGNVTFYKSTSSILGSNSSDIILYELSQIQYDSVKYIFNTSANTLTIKTLSKL